MGKSTHCAFGSASLPAIINPNLLQSGSHFHTTPSPTSLFVWKTKQCLPQHPREHLPTKSDSSYYVWWYSNADGHWNLDNLYEFLSKFKIITETGMKGFCKSCSSLWVRNRKSNGPIQTKEKHEQMHTQQFESVGTAVPAVWDIYVFFKPQI